MARRSFMSGKEGEAAQSLGKKSSSVDGAKSILEDFNINQESLSNLKNDTEIVGAIFKGLMKGTAGLWSMLFSNEVKLSSTEAQFSLRMYEIKGKEEKKTLIAPFTCAKYFAAVLRSAKTLDILSMEISGKTIEADKETGKIYVIFSSESEPKTEPEDTKQ
jgi:hypothetical protein